MHLIKKMKVILYNIYHIGDTILTKQWVEEFCK